MNINLTIIGQLLAFSVFVWFTMRFVWPPLTQALEARRKKIADGLAAAERGEKEQELAQERATEVIKEAKQQANDIVASAQKRANELVEEARTTAREEGERIKESAQAESEQELNRAKEELRKQVSDLAVQGAEQILAKEIDAKAHGDLLKKLAAKL
ncbi:MULTISPECIES: F0F1 ATP synthase subunit B [Thioalkalivibrio]|uniref:ATP synthase subunit b n=1 Tax=Thioalkalivibrio halophilus TaxID=252474 RepID=A0A1V2ZXN3_9GAMM|nr:MULTISPECIES: F0F1 ATP synthase subunit B [Thioalkalivibrio]OOC09826.1 F0F1 ATP synthase subunit B [Thioalkalivibrio halophilus]PYG03575.1 F-type H+-transporting ATPase subunit b [Thioalkalivibrio sp. ALE21]